MCFFFQRSEADDKKMLFLIVFNDVEKELDFPIDEFTVSLTTTKKNWLPKNVNYSLNFHNKWNEDHFLLLFLLSLTILEIAEWKM